jgi:hypothetical protein
LAPPLLAPVAAAGRGGVTAIPTPRLLAPLDLFGMVIVRAGAATVVVADTADVTAGGATATTAGDGDGPPGVTAGAARRPEMGACCCCCCGRPLSATLLIPVGTTPKRALGSPPGPPATLPLATNCCELSSPSAVPPAAAAKSRCCSGTGDAAPLGFAVFSLLSASKPEPLPPLGTLVGFDALNMTEEGQGENFVDEAAERTVLGGGGIRRAPAAAPAPAGRGACGVARTPVLVSWPVADGAR